MRAAWVERLGRVAFACALVLAKAHEARAEAGELSEFEQRTLDENLARLGENLVVDESPDGKLIERVDVVTLEVFDEHDPVPDFLNWFHGTTRERVVRRELLFQEGERYSTSRGEESARNLRDIRQLSLVLVVPVRGTTDERVRVVVVVRDTWSLRLNWDAAVAGAELVELRLNPSEENVLGTHLSVGGLFVLDPGTYSIGAVATQRRILGTKLQASLSANLIYRRSDGEREGGYGAFSYRLPLLSSDQRWGFGTNVYVFQGVTRRYVGVQTALFDARATPGVHDAIPIAYHTDREVGGFEVVRSFGDSVRNDVSLGIEADRRRYGYDAAPDVTPEAAREFERVWLPTSDTRISPFVQLRTREERFLRTVGLETLALQEDVRLGGQALLRLYPASSAVGSTRTLLGSVAGVAYTLATGDGVARAVVEHQLEYETEGRHVAQFEGRLRLSSPRFALGRFVADAGVFSRYQNHLKRRTSLGGETRLRGYAAGEFTGSDGFVANAELRTRSVDVLSVQVGLAAFYDAGHAARRFSELSARQAVGLGFRVLIPQLDRVVFRVDWATPLSAGYDPLPGAFFATFGQAFSMPELAVRTLTSPVTCSPCELPD
jgi:outer membrane protein assembly factor BamA